MVPIQTDSFAVPVPSSQFPVTSTHPVAPPPETPVVVILALLTTMKTTQRSFTAVAVTAWVVRAVPVEVAKAAADEMVISPLPHPVS